MFENKWCVLIKNKGTNPKGLKFLVSFWKKIGSKTVTMSSEQHDRIFSITSHLPHLIAYNLVKSAQDFEKKLKSDLIKYSAGGLRDFSRIAASNEIMWRDIFFDNKANVVKAIDLFTKNLNAFKKDINSKNNKSNMLKVIDLFIKNLKVFKRDIKSNKKNLETKLRNLKKVRQKIVLLKQDTSKPDFGRT